MKKKTLDYFTRHCPSSFTRQEPEDFPRAPFSQKGWVQPSQVISFPWMWTHVCLSCTEPQYIYLLDCLCSECKMWRPGFEHLCLSSICHRASCRAVAYEMWLNEDKAGTWTLVSRLQWSTVQRVFEQCLCLYTMYSENSSKGMWPSDNMVRKEIWIFDAKYSRKTESC